MPKLLVFQHVAYEPLGTLDPHLRREGFRIRYVNFARHPHAEPGLDGYDALVILGGPMNVDEMDRHAHLRHEVRVIREALDLGRPVLGICLGAQLLAHAMGAHVGRASEPEIGWYEVTRSADATGDALLGHFAEVERVFQWHGYTFEMAPGATHLASSERCPNQAFRVGDAAWGLQFHLEVDQPMIARWLMTPTHARDVSGLHGGPEPILRDTERFVARQHALAEEAFGAFVRSVRAHRVPRTLRARCLSSAADAPDA
jgi:GMP synthase (glutamine-hydrolysing)